MYDSEKIKLSQTRRTFLGRTVRGIGSLALASLLNPSSLPAKVKLGQQKWKGILHPTHFAPRAKRVIHLCMAEDHLIWKLSITNRS